MRNYSSPAASCTYVSADRDRIGVTQAAVLAVTIGLASCSSAEVASVPAQEELGTDGSAPGRDDDGHGSGGESEPGERAEGGSSGSDQGTDVDDQGEGSSGGDGASPPVAPPCPPVDSRPSAWIFCEDFEELAQPGDVFFEHQEADGSFVLVEGHGASGRRSMEVRHRPGQEDAGWMSVMFGETPIDVGMRPHHAPEQTFDEIYWRFRIKLEPGWPDVGPNKITRATAYSGDRWGQAMAASIDSFGSGVVLAANPWSCVVDGTVECETYEADALTPLGELVGMTPLFTADYSGQWHCIEGHVRLNDVGGEQAASNGVFEFWVDDVLENRREDLNWRGSWQAYGLNLVSIDNFWFGGPSRELKRWVDDLVVSTERIYCDAALPSR